MALNIQDPNHIIGYDFVDHIIEGIYKEITATQQEDLENFTFHYYSLLIHLILFKNLDIFDQSFFDSTQEWGEILPIHKWTRVWQMFYPYSNVISFYNDFVYLVLK